MNERLIKVGDIFIWRDDLPDLRGVVTNQIFEVLLLNPLKDHLKYLGIMEEKFCTLIII